MAFLAAIPAALAAASTTTATTAAVAGTATAAGTAAAATAAATPWLGYASIASTLLGGAVGAVGAIQQGQAAKASADYNASVSASNAVQAKNNAQIASEAGAEQAAMQEQRNRALVGQEEANTAASGLEVNSGSAVDVRQSSTELGQLDAYQIRSQATREAYGYNVQSSNFKSQADVEKAEGESAQTAGLINAGSTFLGAAGSAGANFAKYQMQGGFSI